MAVINVVRPDLPWQRLVENGSLSNQFECANPSDPGEQLRLVERDGKPALRLMVDSASKYGSSTWLRALGRITPPGARLFPEGSRVAVAKRLEIPAGQRLDGATLIDEAHGPGGVVAPVRLIVRPDGNLYVSMNGGNQRQDGSFPGRTEELNAGSFTLGVPHTLVYLFTFHRDPAQGRVTVWMDGSMVFDRAGATAQGDKSGAYQWPYMLSGLYVGSASVPVYCFIWGVAVANLRSEAEDALAALLGQEPTPDPEPEPEPDPEPEPPVTREDIEALQRTIATLGGKVILLEQREAALLAAAESTRAQKTGNFKTFATKYAGTRPR